MVGESRVNWIAGKNHRLRVVRLDQTAITAVLDTRLSPDGADAMAFRINRLSGDAKIDFLRNSKSTETDTNEAQPKPLTVMGEYSQTGTCSKIEPAF